MVEIEFSVMENSPIEMDALMPVLKAFEAEHHVHVRLTYISWQEGWMEIVKYALYGHGPDLSEVGTTWIGSLARMNALQPFTPQDVQSLGGEQSFFPAAWKSGILPNDSTIWAIPWMGDTHLVYYLPNALEKAGLALQGAFSGHANFVNTLETLQAGGMAYPLALNTVGTVMCLHEACSWIWEAGGSISADGTQVLFNRPEALDGFRNYFNLRRFIAPQPCSIDEALLISRFQQEQIAVTMAGPWLVLGGRTRLPNGNHLGVTSVPGVPYIGGTSFVMWKHSRHPRETLELVRFISKRPHCLPERMLPVHEMDLLASQDNPASQVFLHSMRAGQSFPALRLWGLIEDKLSKTIGAIWADLFATPQQDLDECLHRHLDPLAQRLNITLGE